MLLLHEAKCSECDSAIECEIFFPLWWSLLLFFLCPCGSVCPTLAFSLSLRGSLSLVLSSILSLSLARGLSLSHALAPSFSPFLHFRARLWFNLSLSRARALSLSLPRFQLISHPYWYLCFSHAHSQMACARHGGQCTGLVSFSYRSYRWGQRQRGQRCLCPSSIVQVRKLQRWAEMSRDEHAKVDQAAVSQWG